MTEIEPAVVEAPSTVVDHSGRWVLLGGVGFVLFGGALLLALRLLGL